MPFVSYAQNGEDVLLHRVFGGQQTGFYVDVGAYDPVDGSVTKAFYDRGWSGINIEPGTIFDQLAAARPRDINLRMAVLDRTGTALLQEDPMDRATSRVVRDGNPGQAHEVPCDTLENLVRLHGNGRPVDFLKVDAEGSEGLIVASTDWRRLRPRVLVLEATRPWSNELVNDEWEPLLRAAGYVRVYFDGINCFYLPEEEAPSLERHFKVPINALDQVVYHGMTAAAAAQARAAAEAERDAAVAARTEAERWAKDEVAAAGREVAMARGIVENLQAQLAALATERTELATLHAAATAQAAAERERREALAAALTAIQGMSASPGAPPAVARSPLRRMARVTYFYTLRPVLRPAMHRLRGFMTAPAVDMQRETMARIQAFLALSQGGGSSADIAEVRRLSSELEKVLLTLAMESRPCSAHEREDAAPRTKTDW